MNWIKRNKIFGIGIFSVILSLAVILSGWQMYYVKDNQSQARPNHKTVGTILGGRFVVTVGTVGAASATDYTCDGTADEVQIQAAVDALPATGGMVQILGGTYNWTAGNNTVARAIDNVWILGSGYGTLFNCDATNDLFSAGSQAGWIFSDFATDAGGITYSSATNYTLRNIKVGTSYVAPQEPNKSTVIKALVDPQINISSVGDTYTDVAGNTFAETTNQTRMTTTASYKRSVSALVSVHVSAGTGSVRLYNVTTATGGTARTTTSASEVTLLQIFPPAFSAGDVMTLQVANSTAGATITIDSGGMMEADQITNSFTSTGDKTTFISLPNYITSWKYICLGGLSTASITIQPTETYLLGGLTTIVNLGSSSSTLSSVRTVSLTTKIPTYTAAQLQLNVSAISGTILLGQVYGISSDNQ